MKPPPDPLDSLLDLWSNVPEPPVRLNAEIWQKIATQAGAEPVNWGGLLEGWFGRPVFAVGFVATCALVGLLAAEVQVSHQQRQRNAELARSYLLLIDPLLSKAPEDNRP